MRVHKIPISMVNNPVCTWMVINLSHGNLKIACQRPRTNDISWINYPSPDTFYSQISFSLHDTLVFAQKVRDDFFTLPPIDELEYMPRIKIMKMYTFKRLFPKQSAN